MSRERSHWWLLALGILYPVLSIGALFAVRPSPGVFVFDPLAYAIIAPALVVLSVIVTRVCGVPLHPLAIGLFVLWMGGVSFIQILIFHAASAAV
ncbi:MAG: hypothetical protein IT428_28110 [Planctomycetaceae bacterium]|nr:hypothetical protein [Planctomycetaceae bacterium]